MASQSVESSWVSYRKPEPPHPFAHWVSGDGFVITSGISGHLPDGTISEDFRDQLAAALVGVSRFLEDAGCGVEDIVAMRPILTSRTHIEDLDEGLNRFFGSARPAGLALLICGLADARMKVELEVVARKGAHLIEI